MRVEVMLLGAHAQHADQRHCRQQNGSPHRSPLKSKFAFSSNSDGSDRLAAPGALPSSSIRDSASSSRSRCLDEDDSAVSPFSLRQEIVSSKALSSSASTSCRTPQSSTNKWQTETITFRSAKCIRPCPF